MRQRVGLFVATCGYVGYAPVAPGTFGSAAGLVAFWLVRAFGGAALEVPIILVVFALGVWSATVAEQMLGVDPAPVVLDEVLGMLVTLAFMPVTLTGALVGFLLFRLLDVSKPWPSAQFERLPGGLGVMADDAMAGVYGNLLMRGLVWLSPVGWLA